MSKLFEIAAQRRLDVAEARARVSLEQMKALALARTHGAGSPASSSPGASPSASPNASPNAAVRSPASLAAALGRAPPLGYTLHVAAEFKRASPSKGDMAPSAAPSLVAGAGAAAGAGAGAAPPADLSPEEALVVGKVREYALAGATVVSVLTEPKWFKGSLRDMELAREAVERVAAETGAPRALVLRKDFCVDEYQVYEARAHGADTLLLIVAITPQSELVRLIDAARGLGMEPLVEAANEEETKRALEAGAKVVGINNRDLTTFVVDMNTTVRCAAVVEASPQGKGVLVLALSGIKSREDVAKYERAAPATIRGILVGEHLMRSTDAAGEIRALVTDAPAEAEGAAQGKRATRALVKVCGVVRPSDALAAARAGADLIGVIFAESPRQVSEAEAKAVVDAVRAFRETRSRVEVAMPKLAEEERGAAAGRGEKRPRSENGASNEGAALEEKEGGDEEHAARVGKWFTAGRDALRAAATRVPLVVGVFLDQDPDYINQVAERVGLDLVQLHGNEPWEACREIRLPVIKVVHVPAASEQRAAATEGGAGGAQRDKRELAREVVRRLQPGFALAVLLDTTVKGSGPAGGTGAVFDWDVAAQVAASGVPVAVAGGLTPDNVAEAYAQAKGAWGVDCASGVQASGKPREKDEAKVASFVGNLRRAEA